jgi:hypothetical protein
MHKDIESIMAGRGISYNGFNGFNGSNGFYGYRDRHSGFDDCKGTVYHTYSHMYSPEKYLTDEDKKLAKFERINKHIKIDHLQKHFPIMKNKDEKIWNENHILVLRKCHSKALCPDNHGCGNYCMIYMQIQRHATVKIKSFLKRAMKINFLASYNEIRNKDFRSKIDKKLVSDYNHKEYIIEYKVDNHSEMDYDQNGDSYSVRSYKKKERLGLLGW